MMAELFPLSAMHLHHLEGAVRRQPAGGSAFSHRDPRFVLNIIGTCLDPVDFDAHIGWVRDTWSAVRPYSNGDPYLNFLGDEGQERVRAAYGEKTYARLLTLKQALDPDNVFHLNQNIAPS
jgi:FAD/FMN-containing dehydrogenase